MPDARQRSRSLAIAWAVSATTGIWGARTCDAPERIILVAGQTVDFRHLHVHQDEAVGRLSERSQRFERPGRLVDDIAELLQHRRCDEAIGVVVIDDKDARLLSALGAGRRRLRIGQCRNGTKRRAAYWLWVVPP